MNYKKLIRTPLSEKDDLSVIIKPVEPPEDINESSLNDNETNEVLTYLLYLQEEYFSDIPLKDVLNKKFMWNIPKEVYDAYSRSKVREEPDVLNPLFYLYIFCMEDPHYSIGKFIDIMNNLIGPEELRLIEDKVNLFEEILNDDDIEGEDEDE